MLWANTRMFLILSCWLGNPWKSLSASGQSFFQHSFRAADICSSMDFPTFIIHSAIQCDFQHSPRLRKVSPTYCGICSQCKGSWILWWFPGPAGVWLSRCQIGAQLGYLDGRYQDDVDVLGRTVKKKEKELKHRNVGLQTVFKPAFTGMATFSLTTALLTDQSLSFIPSSSHIHTRHILSLWGEFITTHTTKYLHLMEYEP